MIEGLATFLRARRTDFRTFRVVFDIGSRDGSQALQLAGLFPEAEVIAIECNAQTIEACRRKVERNPRVKLVEKAINSYTGCCDFYPIDPERTITTWEDGNPGASSLFVANGEYPVETYVQKKVEVECIRLDDLCTQQGIDAIDLIWMDLQGAELLALESAGTFLDRVRYIYTEVSHRPIYNGQCMFEDVEAFLTARGFRRCTAIDRSRWQQDAIYENTRELIDVVIPSGATDRHMVSLATRAARNFAGDVRHVYVVGAEDPQIAGTRFIDERAFPFDPAEIRQRIAPSELAETYLLQLVRLYFPLVSRGCLEHVLAVDGRTIFLNSCRFLEGGRSVFNFGDDYHARDFEHMARLHPKLHRMFAYSGNTGCMIFRRAWLDELHKDIEAQHGAPFWKAYLNAIESHGAERGASDYELYFNFCLLFHPGELIIRRLRWREAAALDEVRTDRLDYVNLQDGPIDLRQLEDRILPAQSPE
jgi:FkbM family methyltransferase